jgi:glycosyltransferase involved in cell wall biosynthesis
LKDRALELGLSNVVFIPPVPMTEIGGYLAAADALLVHLRKDPLFEITIPSKIQAYMAMGRPLLLAIQGDGADLVRRSGGGVLAEPESPQSIAEAADSLAQLPAGRLEEMGRNARRFYSEHLSIDKGTMQFARIFARLAAGRRPG